MPTSKAAIARADVRPIQIAFVCDFGIIHARKYIQQFANHPQRYAVTVYSSTLAKDMDGVRLISTVSAKRGAKAKVVSVIWETVRRPLMRWGRGVTMLWAWSMLREAGGMLAFFRATPDLERPDLIHALRAQPEGLGAMGLADRFPGVPFLVSLWGADLVLFTRFSERMRARTAELLRRADVVLPDNGRDERLAHEEFGLPTTTRTFVMPAPGGLDIQELQALTVGAAELPIIQGSPRILCSRGYESAYHKLNLLLRGFRRVLETHPEARLYVEIPGKSKRRAALEGEIRNLGLTQSVTTIHSTRAELQRLMQVCEILAFATAYDGLSMSLLEGMYHGQLPVVFDHESYRPYLVPSENAVVFHDLTEEAVAAALRQAIDRVEGWRSNEAAQWRTRLEFLADTRVWFPRVAALYEEVVI